MRKSFRAGAVAMLAAAAMLTAGCSGYSGSDNGSAASDPNQKVELTYWAWAPNLDKVVEVWNEKNPNIHVTVNANTTAALELNLDDSSPCTLRWR